MNSHQAAPHFLRMPDENSPCLEARWASYHALGATVSPKTATDIILGWLAHLKFLSMGALGAGLTVVCMGVTGPGHISWPVQETDTLTLQQLDVAVPSLTENYSASRAIGPSVTPPEPPQHLSLAVPSQVGTGVAPHPPTIQVAPAKRLRVPGPATGVHVTLRLNGRR